jgi:hypothetical protein
MCHITPKGVFAIAAGLALWLAATSLGTAQVRDAIETARGDIRADRTAAVAEEMQLTDRESQAFWPIYRKYREETDKVTDRLVGLVLEYAELYPDVPEDRAGDMLKEYFKIEGQLLAVKKKYAKKIGKVLPQSKTLRFAQVENRLDTAIRVALGARIPLVPLRGSSYTRPQP